MRMTKVLAFFMTIVMVFYCIPIIPVAEAASETFKDMPHAGHWSAAALKSAVNNNLLNGFKEADGSYIKPDAPLTRAQMAAIVNRAFGAQKKAPLTGVKDVDANAWYAEDLQKAVYMGTMKLDTYMRPNDNITRQEAFTILARAFKMTDGTVDDLSGFADNNLVAGWAVPGVGALVKNGYVKGDGNLLAPEDNITRAQFAVVMDNMIKQYITRAGIVTSVVPGNVMVNVPGVTLKDATVSGDLIIGDGVGDEDVILENVTVTGNLVVRGGGENSVIIKGGGVGGKVVVAKVDGKVRVSVEEGADIEVVVINDGKDDVIIEGTIGMVEVAAPEVPVVVQNGTVGKIEVTGEGGASITVAGDAAVNDVVVGSNASGTTLNVEGRVAKVETSAVSTIVSGTGTVNTVTVKEGADNTAVTTPSTKVNNEGASGVTAGGGAEVPPNSSATNDDKGADIVTKPPSSGGGSGGSGSVAVSAISVEPKELTLGVGETARITATVKPDNATNKNVTWSTSDASKATVDNGIVTAVGEGEATITATAGGKTAEVVVTVLPMATEEEAAELLEWFVGWSTLRFFNEERGNYVSYDFKLKEGKISELSDVTVSIYKGDEKIATNTLIDPSKWSNTTGLSGSFYTNDIEKTSSWYVEQISGALGEDIFDKLVLRAIYGGKVYIVDQAELRPIEGNVKNLTQYKGYDKIQDAIDAASDGDVIFVRPGTYEENLYIDKPLELLGAGRDDTIVQAVQGRDYNGGDFQSPVVMITSNDVLDGITISGFTFKGHIPEANPGNPTGAFGGWGNTGLNGLSTHGILSFDMNDTSIWPPPERKNITITNNKFVYCGGIDLYNVTGFEISNNIMVRESYQIPYYVGDHRYHDKANGGKIAYLSNCKDGVIENNEGYTPKDVGVISIAGGSNIDVVGNCIIATEPLPGDTGFSCAGIRVWNKATDVVVSENTVKGFIDDPALSYYYGAAVLIENSSCEVTGNVLEDSDYGVMVDKISEEQSVSLTDNTITGCATGILLTETCGETGTQISGNTFEENAVHVQDDRSTASANYLEELLANNTFPEGSQVIGNQIKVPTWADLADTSWYNDPSATSFTINTAEQLAGLAKLVNSGTSFNGKTICLGEDIDLENIEWIPIGSYYGTWFGGVFNGNGHKIRGIKITDNTLPEVGLFGYVRGSGAEAGIKNLTVSGTIDIQDNNTIKPISAGNHTTEAGLLAAYVWGFVENCHTTDVKDDNTVAFRSIYTGDRYRASIGGLVGTISIGDITNSSFTGTVYGETDVTVPGTNSGAFIGGLVGLTNGASVLECNVDANVTGNTYRYLALGGAIGYIMGNNLEYSKISYKGAIVGNVGMTGEECESSTIKAGGLIGAGEFGNSAKIEENSIEGSLFESAGAEGVANVSAGGIIGEAYFRNTLTAYSLINNEIDLKISVEQTADAGINVGGLVGKMYNASTSADPSLVITFDECQVSGSINVESTVQGSDTECYVGGLLGSGIKLVDGTFVMNECTTITPTVSVDTSVKSVGDYWGRNDWAPVYIEGAEDVFYPTIQEAVTVAQEGDTIMVGPGTYEGFTVVGSKDITIKGAGEGETIILPEALIETGTAHKYTKNMKSVVFVDNSTGITIQDLTVEDNGLKPDAIVFWNASTGVIEDVAIKGTSTLTGVQTGQGIAVDAGKEETTELTIRDTDISGFNKNGIDVVDGNGEENAGGTITVNVNGGTIKGAGETNVIGQNGIVFWDRGGGSIGGVIKGVTFKDLYYTPENEEACAILDYRTKKEPDITVTDCTFENVEVPIYPEDEQTENIIDIAAMFKEDEKETEEPNITPLANVIQEAIAAKEGIAVSVDGTDLPEGTYWVTQEDMDALDAAITKAEAAREAAETQEDVDDAAAELEAAIAAFNDVKREAVDEEEEFEETGQGEEPAEGEEPEEDEEQAKGEEPAEDDEPIEDEAPAEGEKPEEDVEPVEGEELEE
jgi:hypothetical protein